VTALPIEVAEEAITMEAVAVAVDTVLVAEGEEAVDAIPITIADTNHTGAETTEIDLLVEGAVLALPATAFKRPVPHPSIKKPPWRSS
jgi:hypothetical protein